MSKSMKITLCGSGRFESHFHLWNEILSLSGHIVYGMSVYPSFKKGKKNWYTKEEKDILDSIHLSKIDASDAILVLNVMAYIGASTLAEIEHASKRGKKIYALESWGQGNGVGNNHIESYRLKARELEIEYFRSPIDTFYPHMKEVWDLLPDEAGPYRNRLVKRYDEHKKKFFSTITMRGLSYEA